MSWNKTGLTASWPFASWGQGNMPASYNVGNVPSYLAAYQACPLANCGAGYGIINAGAVSHFNGDSVNDMIEMNKKFAWANALQRTFEYKVNFSNDSGHQALAGSWYATGVASQFTILVYSTKELAFFVKRAGTVLYAKSVDQLTNGEHTLHFVLDAGTFYLYIDGVECAYFNRDTYNLGTHTDDLNSAMGNDRRALYAWKGKIYTANVYEGTALSQARITVNAALGKDMGEVANNVGNEIIFGVPAIARGVPAGIFEGSH